MNKIKYLFISRSLSEFSSAILPVILPLFVLKITHSLALSGLFFMLSMIPSVLITPATGVWIEKYSKKIVAIISLVTMASLCLVQFIFIGLENSQEIFILLIFAILMSVFSMVLDLSSKVLFSEIVDESELEKYNGIKSILDNISVFAAPMLGAVLYGTLGFSSILVLLTVLYLCAFIAFAKITIDKKEKMEEKLKAPFIQQFKEGIEFLKSERKILRYFLLIMMLNFFVASSEEVTNPGIVIQKYQIPTMIFGLVSVAFSLGVILSGIFIAWNSKIDFKKHLPKLFTINSVVMILIGLSSIFMIGFEKYIFFVLMLILEVFLGFITILINVPVNSFFQSQVPLPIQSRFFALLSFSANLSVPLGILYAGFMAEKIGPDVNYILNNILVICIVLFMFKEEKL